MYYVECDAQENVLCVLFKIFISSKGRFLKCCNCFWLGTVDAHASDQVFHILVMIFREKRNLAIWFFVEMRIAAFAWESLKKSRTLAEFIQAKSDCVRCVWYSNNDSIALAQRELNQPQRSTFTYFCHRHSSIFFYLRRWWAIHRYFFRCLFKKLRFIS